MIIGQERIYIVSAPALFYIEIKSVMVKWGQAPDTEISQRRYWHTVLTLKNISITIYVTCVKSYLADDQISHITNQVPDFVHLRILSAFQFETRRK